MESNSLITTKNGVGIYKTRLETFFSVNKTKSFFLKLLFGFLMAVSDGVPGYSGGTTLTIFGYYSKLIKNARTFLGFSNFRKSMRAALWLIPFVIVWIIGALLFAKFITWVSGIGFNVRSGEFTNHAVTGQLILFVTFAIISLFSLPIFFYFHRQVLFCNKFQDYKKPKNFGLILTFIVGFSIILGIGLYIHFCVHTTINNHIYHGFLLTNDGKSIFPKYLYGKLSYVAVISGFLLFFPGISSSLIMLLFGMYSYVYTIIHDHPLLNIVPILITCVCVGTGIILNIFLISFLIKRFPKYFYNFSAGIITGAFITILLACSPTLYTYAHLPWNTALITIIIVLIAILNIYLFLYLLKKDKKKQFRFGFIKN